MSAVPYLNCTLKCVQYKSLFIFHTDFFYTSGGESERIRLSSKIINGKKTNILWKSVWMYWSTGVVHISFKKNLSIKYNAKWISEN